jgi:hypothetical protein
MNLFLLGTIIFVVIYLLLSWLAKTSSKSISLIIRRIALITSIVLAIVLTLAGRFLFSLPLLLIFFNLLKIKGLTAFQIFQLWRLIQYLRSTGKFSFGSKTSIDSSSVTIEESYKILGLKRGCKKEEVLKAATKLQRRIHPDVNKGINTERLSQLVNEAKDKILKIDFS